MDRQFFLNMIANCRKEQDRLRIEFERQEGAIRFCEYIIETELKPKESEKKTVP